MTNDHRPFPKPNGPWIMTQTWNDALFAHWKIPFEVLRPLVPSTLELDTYANETWITVLPFYMTNIHLRGIPPVPGARAFPELNFRTYVTYKNKPAIYFFSLDANHPLAVYAARAFAFLPYFRASMTYKTKENNIFFRSERKSSALVEFKATYSPSSEVYYSEKDSLDYWLTERYRFYTFKNNNLYYLDIHHNPWLLQHASAEMSIHGLFSTHHFPTPQEKPLLHYSKQQKVYFWPLKKVKNSRW